MKPRFYIIKNELADFWCESHKTWCANIDNATKYNTRKTAETAAYYAGFRAVRVDVWVCSGSYGHPVPGD